MHKNTDDRRAKRSRRLLKEGLLSLMQEKKFKDISARDITESADLNRGTFYLHYPDTQALLESIEDDLLGEAQQIVDQHLEEFHAGVSLEPLLLPILDFIQEKYKTITLLLRNSNASSFLDKLHILIYKYCLDYARERFQIRDEIQLVRFEHVFSVLRGGIRSLSYIADCCGFGSAETFRREFRRRTGMSVRDWVQRLPG